jgi:hypothetical protein
LFPRDPPRYFHDRVVFAMCPEASEARQIEKFDVTERSRVYAGQGQVVIVLQKVIQARRDVYISVVIQL